jgi:hypothetical protein
MPAVTITVHTIDEISAITNDNLRLPNFSSLIQILRSLRRQCFIFPTYTVTSDLNVGGVQATSGWSNKIGLNDVFSVSKMRLQGSQVFQDPHIND